jgi:hypothetical protein
LWLPCRRRIVYFVAPRTAILALLAALLLPVAVSQARPSAADVTITQAKFVAKWRESRVSGTFQLSGTASGPADLTFRLASEDGSSPDQIFKATTPGGNFSTTFNLPPTLLPGFFTLFTDGTENGAEIDELMQEVSLKSPPEGVVDRAFATARRNGPPVTRLPANPLGMCAKFFYFAPPKSGAKIFVDFIGPSGRRVQHLNQDFGIPITQCLSRSTRFIKFLSGVWKLKLVAAGRPVKTIRLPVG